MLDLRPYRTGFGAVLVALVVAAFAVDGVPEPLEPEPVTLGFEGERAAATARQIAALAPERPPGSDADAQAAALVRERFEALESGEVAVQEWQADAMGEERTLQNVLLTLPGSGERTVAVVAARDSRGGPGLAGGAAATGVLVELAGQLGVADRRDTVVLASTTGATDESQGARELADALPPGAEMDGAIVIQAPGAGSDGTHLLVTSTEEWSPGAALVRTAEAQLGERAGVAPGLPGPLAQLARRALPGAAGEQAALNGAGIGAVALSGAGEATPAAETEELDPAALEGYGLAALATLSALDPPAVESAPEAALRLGDNLVPGWAVGLLALALAVPALALATSAFAAAARKGERPGRGWRWALGWLVAPAAGLALLAALALTGIVPSPAAPFDPAAFELGPAEAVAIAAVALAGLAAWWALGLRRLPIGLPRPALAAGCVLAAAAPLTVVWVVNPFTALLLVPLLHPLAAFALAPRARRPAIAVLAIVALAPLALGLAHVAAELGWGADAPWQLAMLASGGGAGPIWLLGVVGTLAAAAALVWAGVAPERRRVPPPPGAPTRGGPVTPPARA